MTNVSFEDLELQQLRLDDELLEEEVYNFFDPFRKKYNEYAQQGDERLAHLYDLLTTVVILRFYPDQKDVFGTPEELGNVRLFVDGQPTGDDEELLRVILRNIDNAALKARIGDILWHFKRDYKSARTAITAYVDYAKLNDDPEEWIEPVHALTRALTLAKSLGKNSPEIETVLQYIEQCVIRENAQDPLFYSNRLIQLLLDNNYGDTKQLAQLAEKLAQKEEKNKESSWHRAEEHWQLAAECYRKLKDEDNERRVIISKAETWVKAVNLGLKNPNLARFQISYQLEKAINIYRSLPETHQKVEELHKLLLNVQKEATKQMAPISISLEGDPKVEEMRQNAIKAVSDENFLSSFIKFALLHSPLSHDYLVQQAKDDQGRYFLKRLLPTKVVDAFGRNVANPPQSEEETLLADVFQHQNLYRQSFVGMTIEPARQEILYAHTFTLHDLAPIITSNLYIPYGHKYSVLKGIVAGLQGDFLSAAHILVPQLESTLRHILVQKEKITSKYTSEGIQDEISLNRMLEEEENSSVLSEVLGKDTIYELRGLLVDRFGANLRNNLAHGLLFDGQFFSAQSIYLWYLAVNIYSRPFIFAVSSNSDNS